MYIYIWIKKTHLIYLKSQIFLFFINVKLLKRREIFVILNKLCVFS